MAEKRKAEKLCCGHKPRDPWPPPGVEGGPPPGADPLPADQRYNLRGPQVEPEAAFWTVCRVCRAWSGSKTSSSAPTWTSPADACYFPPYPTDPGELRAEIEELIALASLRDDPEALASNEPGRERAGISPFLQLRPQPIGAVVNIERDPVLAAVRAGRQPEPGALAVARGEEVNPAFAVIRTGRELARYFEAETPGLGAPG